MKESGQYRASLSWSLVIATANRPIILAESIRLAVQQPRQPSQIIVVDASDAWEESRDHIFAMIASAARHIEWHYVPAAQRSITIQRNQGIDIAEADVVFFFDDDTLMFPGCVEHIMRIYESDTEHKIAGVAATSVDRLPPGAIVSDATKPTGAISYPKGNALGLLLRWVNARIMLMNAASLFIPYDGEFKRCNLPDVSCDAVPVTLMQGFRMTYRYAPLAIERFDPLLRDYATFEDLDCSYRISRHGCLVEATQALVHHFQSNSGRLPRRHIARIGVLNQAMLLRKNAKHLSKAKTAFYLLMVRRLFAEFVKDVLSRRWSLPQFLGIIAGLKHCRVIFSATDEKLVSTSLWFPDLLKENG